MHAEQHIYLSGLVTRACTCRMHVIRLPPLLNTYNKRETVGVGAEGKPHADEESVPHRHSCSEAEA